MSDELEVEDPELKTVMVLLPDGRQVEGQFTLWTESPERSHDVMIELRFLDRDLRASSEVGFFDALLRIRAALEAEGTFLLCYGASRTVHPSFMSRTMGSGDLAYRIELGRKARQADLISIFESGPDVIPASIEEQEAFYRQWLTGLDPFA